jgi:hypothetical protein
MTAVPGFGVSQTFFANVLTHCMTVEIEILVNRAMGFMKSQDIPNS